MSQDNNNQGSYNYGAGMNDPRYYQQNNGGYYPPNNGQPMNPNYRGQQQNMYGYPQGGYQQQPGAGQYRANPMPQQQYQAPQQEPEQPKKPEKKKKSVDVGETLSRIFVGTLSLFMA